MSPSLEKQYTSVDIILQERGNRYGKFSGHAELTQALKATFTVTLSTTHYSHRLCLKH